MKDCGAGEKPSVDPKQETVELVKKPRHSDEMDFVASVRILLSENSRLQAILGSHFFDDIRPA